MKFILPIILISFSAFGFDWQGHRGARGLYPENTIGAMEEALKYNVSTLEMDVVISKDLKVVVSHEPWMNPEMCLDPHRKEIQSERQVNLYKINYDEIQKYDCGSKVHPRFTRQVKVVVGKPLLFTLITDMEKKLRELRRTEVGYNIEIKSTLEDEKAGFQPEYQKFTDFVVKEVTELLPYPRFTLQSFDKRVLKYLHEKYPKVQVSALQEEKYEAQVLLKDWGFTPQIFSPDYTLLTEQDIAFFHSKGIKVIPWTVNSIEDMKKVISLKTDGIITDYPDLISQVGLKTCKKGYNYFEGQCVSLPQHALSTTHPPGWVCEPGYNQWRFHCEKIRKPAHSIFLEDGKTWVCEEGFVRYRSKCKKKSNEKSR
jgi:glycerophosphoryl diester phosphodiesterase